MKKESSAPVAYSKLLLPKRHLAFLTSLNLAWRLSLLSLSDLPRDPMPASTGNIKFSYPRMASRYCSANLVELIPVKGVENENGKTRQRKARNESMQTIHLSGQ